MNISTQGWIEGIRQSPSPNCDDRPEAPYLLILHFISLPPQQYGNEAIRQFFTNQLNPQAHPFFAAIAHLRVSSHVVIYRTGEIEQFVSFNQRAWHAGVSSFEGRERCNDFSIGIELEGCEFEPFTAAQYATLAHLVPLLKQQYPLRAVCGHEDVAPGRKNDPGPYFDWNRFHQECWQTPCNLASVRYTDENHKE